MAAKTQVRNSSSWSRRRPGVGSRHGSDIHAAAASPPSPGRTRRHLLLTAEAPAGRGVRRRVRSRSAGKSGRTVRGELLAAHQSVVHVDLQGGGSHHGPGEVRCRIAHEVGIHPYSREMLKPPMKSARRASRCSQSCRRSPSAGRAGDHQRSRWSGRAPTIHSSAR